jgi:hypothetical protein
MADDDLDFPSSFEDDDLDSFDDDDLTEFDETDQEADSKGRFNFNRRYLLIGFVALALLCLVGIVIFRVFTEGGDEVADRPTATPQPTDTQPTVIATISETEPTPAPTRVIEEEPAEDTATEPTVASTAAAAATTPTPTPVPTSTPVPPTPISSPGSTAADLTMPVAMEMEPGPPEDQLINGDFEAGFDDRGVAMDWRSFDNGSVTVSYSPVTAAPLVNSGDSAQRISVAEANQPDRHAGLYQQMEVVANQPYTLTLHGQIRTGEGSTEASSYGYRMQYAIDPAGGDDWRDVPAESWIELPWDEQPLDSPAVTYLPYTTVITPTSDQLTLFVRTWNKWPDPGLAEYTLDDVSLVGVSSAPAPVLIAAGPDSPDDGDALIPETGDSGPANFLADARFWGALLILLLLSAGAIYRGRWGY